MSNFRTCLFLFTLLLSTNRLHSMNWNNFGYWANIDQLSIADSNLHSVKRKKVDLKGNHEKYIHKYIQRKTPVKVFFLVQLLAWELRAASQMPQSQRLSKEICNVLQKNHYFQASDCWATASGLQQHLGR